MLYSLKVEWRESSQIRFFISTDFQAMNFKAMPWLKKDSRTWAYKVFEFTILSSTIQVAFKDDVHVQILLGIP